MTFTGFGELAEWIAPAKSGEPSKVIVVRMKLSLMFDRKSCQVKIRGQLSCNADALCEILDEIEMPRSGVDDSGLRLFQPGSNMADCLLHGERSIQNASAGHDP